MLLDNEVQFEQNADGLYLVHQQAITSDFLERCKDLRSAQEDHRKREMNMVASVPTHVVEIWLRQGIDVWIRPGNRGLTQVQERLRPAKDRLRSMR